MEISIDLLYSSWLENANYVSIIFEVVTREKVNQFFYQNVREILDDSPLPVLYTKSPHHAEIFVS